MYFVCDCDTIIDVDVDLDNDFYVSSANTDINDHAEESYVVDNDTFY